MLAGGPLLLWQVPAIQHWLVLMRHWAGQPWALLRVLPLAVLYCALGLPRQALCLALGAGFGVANGLLEASLAYGMGAMAGYGWGRLWRFFHPGQSRPVPWYVRAGLSAPFRTVLCVRLLPLGSALLASVSSGLARLPAWRFLLATMLGGLPQNLVFLLAGSGVETGHGGALVAAIMLALLSAMLAGWVLRGFHRLAGPGNPSGDS